MIRVHIPCRSEVDDCTGQFCCQECGVTHLNEMLNKPGQQVRVDKNCREWKCFTIFSYQDKAVMAWLI